MAISDRITAITNHLTDDWNSIDRLGLHTNILPKEYTQVDYIESNGTQYIDTGINADNKLNVMLDMAFTSPTLGNQNIGAILTDGSTTVRYHILCDSSQNNNFRMYTNTNYVGVGTLDANRHTFEFDCSNGKVYFDGTTYNKDTTNFDVGLNFWLFGRNSTSTKYYSNVKQYGCKMYYNNVLVRDFIPCFRNTDNEVGLYDLINNVFYTNQGTGTFTYGQVQEQHIDKNIENIKEPLDLFYNEVSDKTDISTNGIVGRTSQETTTGKNLYGGGDNLTNQFSYLLPCETGKTYTLSFKAKCTADESRVFFRTYTDLEHTSLVENEVTRISTTMNSYSLTLTSSIDGYLFLATATGIGLYSFENIMVEIGSTPSTFEPYTGGQPSPNPSYPQNIEVVTGENTIVISNSDNSQSQSFPVNLGNIELCKIGTYKDRIYKSNDKWYLEKNIAKVVLNGSENWTLSGSNNEVLGVYSLSTGVVPNATSGFCTHYKIWERYVQVSNSYGVGVDYIRLRNDLNFANSNEVKTWLSSNNITIYYPLATPTTTEITDSTLISQLNTIQDYLVAYKINKEFILGYSSPTIEWEEF